MIQVTEPYFPDIEKYQKYLTGIYDRKWLTNFGPLEKELKARLEDYLGVENLLLVANGTSALQVAFKAMSINESAITTPFTFVATSSAMQWLDIKPVYADIDPKSFNLDPHSLLSKINNNSDCSGIVPVHVFGNPCEVERIEKIAQDKNIPVVYDAAHAFGVKYKGDSLLKWGDASVLSFHATKVFHTVEGGAVIFKSKDSYDKAKRMINFGMEGGTGNIIEQGINAKLSELHAAMGLSVLDSIDQIIDERNGIVELYKNNLDDAVVFQEMNQDASLNGAYVSVVLKTKEERDQLHDDLISNGVMVRKYFSPSLDTIPRYNPDEEIVLPNSAKLAERVLCLPVYVGLKNSDVKNICKNILELLCE
jgi:dTDP-4-amino-4,6-dideoxygalactose transaminase